MFPELGCGVLIILCAVIVSFVAKPGRVRIEPSGCLVDLGDRAQCGSAEVHRRVGEFTHDLGAPRAARSAAAGEINWCGPFRDNEEASNPTAEPESRARLSAS